MTEVKGRIGNGGRQHPLVSGVRGLLNRAKFFQSFGIKKLIRWNRNQLIRLGQVAVLDPGCLPLNHHCVKCVLVENSGGIQA